MKLSVMGPEGHVTIAWSPDNEAETDAAAKAFDDLKAKGYSFWLVKTEKDGTLDKGKQLKRFRDDAGKLVLELVEAKASKAEVVAVPKVKGG